MKKRKMTSLLLAFTGALVLGTAVPAGADGNIQTQVITVSQADAKTDGWETISSGKRYLVAGKPVKGLYNIQNKTYVFDSKGILQISKWTKVGEIKYYSDSKGTLVRNKLIKWNGSYYYVKEDGTALKNGWKTLPDGKTCYFGANGMRYTGIRKVDGKTYGFSINAGYLMKNRWIKKDSKVYRTDAAGEIQKSKLVKVDGNYYYLGSNGVRYYKKWKTFSEGKSYFNSKAIRVTGEEKINGKLYYFNSNGYLATGKSTVKAGNTTYYLDGKGVVEMKTQKVGSVDKYYNTAGNEMTAVAARNYLTLQTAKGIAAQITNDSMSKEQKLFACFQWVVKKPYITRRPFVKVEGWPAIYANDHFLLGGGNCHADASAFAYLAKAIGYTNVYVCTDSATSTNGHSWTEINGLAYDPLFWEGKGKKAKYYGGAYGNYELSPILHIAI